MYVGVCLCVCVGCCLCVCEGAVVRVFEGVSFFAPFQGVLAECSVVRGALCVLSVASFCCCISLCCCGLSIAWPVCCCDVLCCLALLFCVGVVIFSLVSCCGVLLLLFVCLDGREGSIGNPCCWGSLVVARCIGCSLTGYLSSAMVVAMMHLKWSGMFTCCGGCPAAMLVTALHTYCAQSTVLVCDPMLMVLHVQFCELKVVPICSAQSVSHILASVCIMRRACGVGWSLSESRESPHNSCLFLRCNTARL